MLTTPRREVPKTTATTVTQQQQQQQGEQQFGAVVWLSLIWRVVHSDLGFAPCFASFLLTAAPRRRRRRRRGLE